MKKKDIKRIVKDIFESIRPNTWLRVWGEMVVAAALASYPYFDFFSLLKTFLIASPLLWSGMYMLNDITDVHLDNMHPLRSKRPITKGAIHKKTAVLFILILSLCAFIIGTTINLQIVILLFVLTFSQIAYTLPPLRLKERPFWDITVNSFNSAIRFLLGWFSQQIIHPFFLYPLLLFICIKGIFFIGHRIQNRKLELEAGIKSTVTLFQEYQLKVFMGILGGLLVFLFILSISVHDFPLNSLWVTILGFLPFGGYLLKEKKRELFLQEKSLKFRNFLYFEYFVITNLIALTIIYR